MDKIISGISGSKVPLRPGYRWNRGEWVRNETVDVERIDTSCFGMDDGVLPKEGGAPLSSWDDVGDRGEGIYTLRTAYTEICIDGEKDPIYDYGIHLKGAIGSDEEYYKDRETCIEVYMIRGQNGKVYVYGEVTDPDIVIDPTVMATHAHHCDGLHVWVCFENSGAYPSLVGLISADVDYKCHTPCYPHMPPKGCVSKRTEKGFKFEFCFDKMGHPLMSGDEMGFGFYYNDTNDFVDPTHFKRCIVKLPQKLNPVGTKYISLDNLSTTTLDAVRFSAESAYGSSKGKEDDTPPKSGDMIADILSGASSVNVVYSSDRPVHCRNKAKYIAKWLCYGGADAQYVRNNGNARAADYEIEFDDVGSPAGAEFVNSLEYNQYGLRFSDNKIIVAGRREDAVNAAAELLISAFEYVKAGGRTGELDGTYVGAFDWVPNAPRLDGLTRVTDAAYGAYLLLKENADESDYKAYIEKLEKAGYEKHAENTMASVFCATYCNDSAIVNVTYGSAEGDRSLRVAVDPRSTKTLPFVEKDGYPPVCKTTVSQLDPARTGYMCYVFKQDNGEYLVIDSGGNGAHKFLHDSLLELNGGERVTVSAWIFSHFHCDHIGGFLEMGDREEYMKDITVKRVIHNFPQKQVTDTALNPGDQSNLARWPGVVAKCGSEVSHLRTGEKYRFGNIDVEVIFTFEDLMPMDLIADRTNPTSSVVSVTVEGQRFIITGDCCGEATTLMVKRYGDWLKTDFVQLPHHGLGDGGTDLEFYKRADAPYVLFPNVRNVANKAEKWACEYAKEYFLNPGMTTTLKLPYKPQ